MVTFTSPDNEFAAATGSNIGVTGTTSQFDNPPNAFKNLEITSNDGDPEPFIFDIGDTYDVTWTGHGGGGTIEDATVVRSDVAGGDINIVVLEGINSHNGEVVQIIWTPDFDLEGWYWNNYTPSADPQFYIVDNDGGSEVTLPCLCADTRIETPDGPRRLRDLQLGDRVITQDRGAKPIRWITSRRMVAIGCAAPVVFAPGAIGNSRRLLLSQQHRVLLRDPALEIYTGHTEVLVPARAMVNGSTIRLEQRPFVTWMNLATNAHDLILAEGAQVETLFPGDQTENLLSVQDKPLPKQLRTAQPARALLSMQEAQRVLAILHGAPNCQPAPALI